MTKTTRSGYIPELTKTTRVGTGYIPEFDQNNRVWHPGTLEY